MNLQEKVNKVNEILDSYGSVAIQEDTSKSFKSIGYRPQYLLDAMNTAFGQGNWKHNIIDIEIADSTYTSGGNEKTRTTVTVKLNIQFLNEGQVVFETGTHVGGAFVLAGNTADAIKSAITDGIGKNLSLLSVGNKAYRGELKVGKGTVKVSGTDITGVPEKISNNRFKPKTTKTGGGSFRKPAKKLSNTDTDNVAVTTSVETPVQTPPAGGNGSFKTRFGNVANENAVASFADSGLSEDEENVVNDN